MRHDFEKRPLRLRIDRPRFAKHENANLTDVPRSRCFRVSRLEFDGDVGLMHHDGKEFTLVLSKARIAGLANGFEPLCPSTEERVSRTQLSARPRHDQRSFAVVGP